MPCYNFKSITIVPAAKTQRKTPTVIHKQYAIGRIRHFYMRKVKTCQQFFHDKLQTIITEFPKVEDHYKLALSQLNTAKNLIDGIARDQLKILKYGESLYQCKTLKRSALGRMCTVIKRQADNLKFLENTRQHMSRLPTIDPDTRTLILCGYPNVGKSSFINKITRADVDVQPFPFTTKSLFVGHTDYKNLRWQVIDTPGVLNRPLEEHNTIEMLSITALAHLHAAVIYLMDLSEQCGYTIAQQIDLFQNLKPLFRNKPLVIAANKIDVRPFESIPDSDKEIIRNLVRFPSADDNHDVLPESDRVPLFIEMSTFDEVGLMAVRSAACDDLLARRVQAKLRISALPGTDADISSRLYIAKPNKDDNVTSTRPPNIPSTVMARLKARAQKRLNISAPSMQAINHDDETVEEKTKRTMRDRELEADPYDGFILNLREHWNISNPHEANDIIPEIMDGHNLIDMFDQDIEQRLNELEEQESAMEKAGLYEQPDLLKDEEWLKIRDKAEKIREVKALRILESRSRKRVAPIPRSSRSVSAKKIRKDLGELGLDVDMTEEAERGRSLKRAARARNSTPNPRRAESIARASVSRSRSGVRDEQMHNVASRKAKLAQRKYAILSRKGEGDHHIPNLKPKHLFSGKRTVGKTDRR